jgi:hypothetical protein
MSSFFSIDMILHALNETATSIDGDLFFEYHDMSFLSENWQQGETDCRWVICYDRIPSYKDQQTTSQ